MIKNLKILKNNLTAIALASTMVFMSGCSKGEPKQYESSEPTYSTIYMTQYDANTHELYWDEISQSELESIDNRIIAIEEIQDNTLYVANYYCIGYQAAMRNDTKTSAKKSYPEYADSSAFSAGYDMGKADKYLKKAEEEQRTYVSIRAGMSEETAEDEANYYPLDELTVVSYDGINAIVIDYNEDNIKDGNYEDLLGQDMTSYIGQEFNAITLREFATRNCDTLSDAIYIVSDDYHYIAEITTATMSQVNTANKKR